MSPILRLEKVILRNLITNEEYSRKALPFLKEEYFSVDEERALFNEVRSFILKYNVLPTLDAIAIEVNSLANLKETQIDTVNEYIDEFKQATENTNIQWLLDNTESFCQDKAIYKALTESIQIANNKGLISKGSIPKLLSDALSVSFDPHVGHDYLEDFDERYDYYHRVLDRIPFDLEIFNRITKGGLPKKTLNIVLAGTGVGKSLFMCHVAAACLLQQKNVLYITLELAEEEVAKRIDANLMNVTFDDLLALPKELYLKKAQMLKSKAQGKLIVKEYPTASASTIHFKALLNELALKKDFIPDIIFVDYLNICMSARVKPGSNINSYTYVKSIAEELRGLGVEHNVPIFSATQTTRSGFTSSDPGLEDTSESFGLPATADLMFALISTDDLKALGQLLVKQLKNRYSDVGIDSKFVIGIERAKMRLYDLDASAQTGISGNNQTPAIVGPITSQFNHNKSKFSKLQVK